MTSVDIQNQELRRLLSRPETVIFVGAGISNWSGLPNWGKLVEELLIFTENKTGITQTTARKRLAELNLVAAADRLMSHLQPSEFANFLRNDLQFGKARPHTIHELITKLGPTCFITTNYDNLLEQQLHKNGKSYVRTVTNRQLADMADIYRADARNFVFKPHGDLNDASSLVITQTQFNDIILGDSKDGVRSVYKTLEILIATRPILFLGYSLSDLDLQLILRGLQNAFDQSAGTYWAILPDLEVEDREELWKKYGLRAISYETTKPKRPTESWHSALLELFTKIAQHSSTSNAADFSYRSDLQFDLAKYGARLSLLKTKESYPLRVRFYDWMHRTYSTKQAREFNNYTITQLLTECRQSFILEGPAGSGKSFSIRNWAAEQGAKLRDWALLKTDTTSLEVSLVLDARLYDGDFLALSAAQTELNFDHWGQQLDVTLILDSLDEMPASHLEEGKWYFDLKSFISKFRKSRVVYCSRRSDLVRERDLPVFTISGLSAQIVENKLDALGFRNGNISDDVQKILQTPFVLDLVEYSHSRLSRNLSIAGLFASFVSGAISRARLVRYENPIQVLLQRIAFEANQTGQDTIYNSHLELLLDQLDPSVWSGRQVLDNLVAGGLFVSEINGRVRFAHRAILEYLAGREVAQIYGNAPTRVVDLLTSNRWDNALAWSSLLLTSTAYMDLINKICAFDIILAFRLARSAEFNADKALEQVLIYICNNVRSLRSIEINRLPQELENTQFFCSSVPWLQKLSKLKDSIGGASSLALMPFAGDDLKKGWIEDLCKGKVDYNKANYLASALGHHLDDALLLYLFSAASKAKIPPTTKKPNGSEHNAAVFHWHGIACLFRGFSKKHQMKTLIWAEKQDATLRAIVTEALHSSKFKECHRFLVRQWEAGLHGADFYLYMWVRYDASRTQVENNFSPSPIRFVVLRKWLLTAFGLSDVKWTIELVRYCCQHFPLWRKHLALALKEEKLEPWIKQVFRLSLEQTHSMAAEELLLTLKKQKNKISNKQLALLSALDTQDYHRDLDTVMDLLTRRQADLVNCLAQNSTHLTQEHWPRPLSDDEIRRLISEIAFWSNSKDKSSQFCVGDLADLLTSNMTSEATQIIVAKANDANDKDRDTILTFVIPSMSSHVISTDDLTEDTARLLVHKLSASQFLRFGALHSIAAIVTEKFVENILLPMRDEFQRDAHMSSTIEAILDSAGARHGRRYNLKREH